MYASSGDNRAHLLGCWTDMGGGEMTIGAEGLRKLRIPMTAETMSARMADTASEPVPPKVPARLAATMKYLQQPPNYIRANYPRIYAAVIRLAADHAIKDIAAITHLEPAAVKQIIKKEITKITDLKRDIAARCAMVARQTTEEMEARLDNAPGEIPANCLGPWLGIALDKMQSLQGEASRIIDVRVSAAGRDEFVNLLKAVRPPAAAQLEAAASAPAQDAEFVEALPDPDEP